MPFCPKTTADCGVSFGTIFMPSGNDNLEGILNRSLLLVGNEPKVSSIKLSNSFLLIFPETLINRFDLLI